MSRPSKSYEEVKNKLMQNPELRKIYEENKPFSEIAMELVKIRSMSNLSQAELAKKIGTTQSVISKIESLDIEDIKLSTLFKVAKALNMKVEIKFISAA